MWRRMMTQQLQKYKPNNTWVYFPRTNHKSERDAEGFLSRDWKGTKKKKDHTYGSAWPSHNTSKQLVQEVKNRETWKKIGGAQHK